MFETVVAVINYFGIVVFAVSGALVASRKEMDLLGFWLVATVTGIGGGTLRDVILDVGPVFWVKAPLYLYICAGTATIVYFAARFIHSRLTVLIWADAIGLAAFAVLGSQAALAAGASPVIAVGMGVMSATFGGIIRDVICNEYPLILLPEIYATAAFAGAGVHAALIHLGVASTIALMSGFVVGFGLRAAAILFKLKLPTHRRPASDRSRPDAGSE